MGLDFMKATDVDQQFISPNDVVPTKPNLVVKVPIESTLTDYQNYMEDDSVRQEESDRNQEAQSKKAKMEAGNSLYGSGKGSFVYENGQLV
jgi:hypothetical protein